MKAASCTTLTTLSLPNLAYETTLAHKEVVSGAPTRRFPALLVTPTTRRTSRRSLLRCEVLLGFAFEGDRVQRVRVRFLVPRSKGLKGSLYLLWRRYGLNDFFLSYTGHRRHL